jgi:hypothetical protein
MSLFNYTQAPKYPSYSQAYMHCTLHHSTSELKLTILTILSSLRAARGYILHLYPALISSNSIYAVLAEMRSLNNTRGLTAALSRR